MLDKQSTSTASKQTFVTQPEKKVVRFCLKNSGF